MLDKAVQPQHSGGLHAVHQGASLAGNKHCSACIVLLLTAAVFLHARVFEPGLVQVLVPLQVVVWDNEGSWQQLRKQVCCSHGTLLLLLRYLHITWCQTSTSLTVETTPVARPVFTLPRHFDVSAHSWHLP
jgi:hypothetical protein